MVDSPINRESKVDAIIAGYLEAEANGKLPDRRQLLERYPDFADELETFFTDHDDVRQLADPLRRVSRVASGDDRVEVTMRFQSGDTTPRSATEFDSPSPPTLTERRPAGTSSATGSRIGDFEVLEKLGEGGMGVVYKARHVKLKRTVALKMISAGVHAKTADLERFRMEAEAVARLQHPCIVQIYEIGEHDGMPFLSLEYCDGGNLAQELRGTPLPPRAAAELVEQLAHAIQAAHGHNVVHRDLKPANVLLSGKPEVSAEPQSSNTWRTSFNSGTATSFRRVPKITDFGLAKILDDRSDLTQTGTVVGTPSYMAPEQAASGPKVVGPAADIYALGTILYEALTGRPPFKATNALDTVMQVLSEEPVPPSQLQPKLPRDIETICLKCLRKDGTKRYESAAALADDLHRFCHDEPIRARRTGALERGWRWCRRNPALAVASVLAVVALVATAGISVAFAVYQSRSAADLSTALTDARDKGTLAENRRKESEKQRRLAEMRLADSYLKRARTLCEQGEVSRGMLWLARSFEIAPKDAQNLRWAIRANLAHWARQMRALRATLPHARPVRRVAFSPDCRVFLTDCGDKSVQLWDAHTHERLGKPLPHHGSTKTAVFSPDGETILTLTTKNSAQLWNVATGKPKCKAFGHPRTIMAAAFNPNGKTILTGGADGTARLWDASTGEANGQPLRHPGHVHAVAFSPDGQTIAIGGTDRTIRQWNAMTGEPIGKPLKHHATIASVAFGPDGRTLLASAGSYALLWDASSRRLRRRLYHPPGAVTARFSPDGKAILTVSARSSFARLWHVGTKFSSKKTFAHTGWATTATFSPDGTTILTGSSDLTAKFWDAQTGKPVGPLLQHLDCIESATFSGDGKFVLTGSKNGTIRLWDAGVGTRVGSPLRHVNRVKAVAFAPNDSFIVTGGWGRLARRWDIQSGKLRNGIGVHPNHVLAVTVSPDGKSFLTGGEDGHARLWESDTGKLLRVFSHQGGVQSVAFASTGQTIVTGSRDCMVRVWNTATGKLVHPPFRHKARVFGVACSPDAKYVVAAYHDNTARIWQIETGKPTGVVVRHQGSIWAVAFSPDGKFVLTGSEDRTAQLWDATTGEPVGPAFQHKGPVKAVAFSPDGRIVLTGDINNSAHLWDAGTGNRIGPTLRHSGWVECVAFSHDGHTMATGSGDGNVRLWQVPRPVHENLERIQLWVQLITGMQMDESGAVQSLDAQTLQQRRRRLNGLGGSPVAQIGRSNKPKTAFFVKRPPIDHTKLKDSKRLALALNGRGDHIVAPFIPFYEYKALTVEVWVKNWKGAILCQGRSRDPENSLWLSTGSNTTGNKPQHSCGWESGSGRNHEYSVGYGKPNEWNHVAMVFDGARQLVFLNGVLQSARPALRPGPFDKTRRLIIGAHNHGRLAFGSGLLGPVRISQVVRYRKNFTPSWSWKADNQTVLHYDLAQGKGRKLEDTSGNDRHGVIHNSRWISIQP